jgi:hypothetical protein
MIHITNADVYTVDKVQISTLYSRHGVVMDHGRHGKIYTWCFGPADLGSSPVDS